MTVDIEKAFDSINYSFLMCVLKKFGFGNDFRKWLQILIKNSESWIINGGKTTPYFKLERGTRQGHLISAYLFIRVLEVVFSLIKANPDIKGLQFLAILSYTLLLQMILPFFFKKREISNWSNQNFWEFFSLFGS